MEVNAKVVAIGPNGQLYLSKVSIEQIQLGCKCILSIDGSTDITGIGILRESDGVLIACASFHREKEKDESPVQYKVRLKREIYKLLHNNNNFLLDVYYEEPFIGYVQATKNLLMLRTFVEELKFEYEDELSGLQITEVNNQKWKRLFLAPDKCPPGTELQKKCVRDKLIKALPILSEVTQDEVDAISMGITACTAMRQGEQETLKSKKKTKPFKYKTQFIGADDDDIIFQSLLDVCEAPKEVMENGIVLRKLNGRGRFDNAVYEEMGSEDKLLILKFDSSKYGNVILENRIGHLAETYTFIYALVWRNTRKR